MMTNEMVSFLALFVLLLIMKTFFDGFKRLIECITVSIEAKLISA